MIKRLRIPEKTLLYAVRFGVGLLLLTPLVMAVHTAYPSSVGKAVYTRSIIEVVFVLWVLLALAVPSWRPPRSWLLVLLAAGLGVSVLSAVFGVSPLRSFWSTYIRMQGTVDLAHWLALAVVAASVFRTSYSLRVLLTFQLGVGLAVSLAAIASYQGWAVPILGVLPEQHLPRVGATLGNPTFLGAYLLVNVVLGLGFLVRSFIPASPPTVQKSSRHKAQQKESVQESDALAQWVGRAFYGLVVLFGLWGIGLSGSMAALAGVLAAVGVLMLLYSFLARSRRVRLAVRAALGATTAVATAGVLVVFLAPSLVPAFDSPLLKRATNPDSIAGTLGKRLAIWEAGVKGFADRPMLGWGEDNFVVLFGRHVTGYGTTLPASDHAHNRLIEEAATKGAAGLAVYVVIWILTFLVILRGSRGVDSREQAFALFAGAALLGQLVQSQALFNTASSSLQYVLLLAVAIRFEGLARLPKPGWRLPGGLAAAGRHWAARGGIVLGAAALGGAGLASNQTIYSGAAALYRAEVSGPARFMDELKNAIDAFGPLANVPRMIMFENVTENWHVLRVRHRAEAMRLLRWSDVESVRAVEDEPENWMVQHALARLYRAVSMTDPEYADRAKRHFERSLELAPDKDPLVPLYPPDWRRKHQERSRAVGLPPGN